jgi:hypothetical protein
MRNTFTIIEYVPLGLNDKTSYYPLKKQSTFTIMGIIKLNVKYCLNRGIQQKMLFSFIIQYCFAEQTANFIVRAETQGFREFTFHFMICYLNGFEEAKQKLIDAKVLLKPFIPVYLSFKSFTNIEKNEV